MPAHKRTACLNCAAPTPTLTQGRPGQSALREYERRSQRREDRAREAAGGLGVAVAHLTCEPQSIRAWKQGGEGERHVGQRLTELLSASTAQLLHDRRVPWAGRLNIDHLAVGAGGVTVIDAKTHRGRIRVERVGLFPRREILRINGRNQTKLIDGIERQLDHVRRALAGSPFAEADVRGALCFPAPEGLPLLGRLFVRRILIAGPRGVANLADRPGTLAASKISELAYTLARQLPEA